jgi:cell division septal protein FtsQ
MARPKKRKKAVPYRKKTQVKPTGTHPIGGLVGFILKMFPLVLIIGLLGGSVFGVKEVLYADPALIVQEIRISPLGVLSPEKLISLEKKLMGQNILDVNLKEMAVSLEKNPQIQRAAVIRQMPSTIKIDVQIRNPIAFIHFSPQSKYALIAEDGVILDYVDQGETSLVLIQAYGMGLKAPDAGYQIRSRGFSEATKFLKAYWEHPLSEREDITALDIDQAGSVSMKLHDGLQIRLGRQPSTRLATMEKISHLLEGDVRDKIDYIDLQFDNVIVKKKEIVKKK